MSDANKTFLEKASEGISNVTESATNAYNGAKESVGDTLNDYSSKNVINASSGFLNANGMIAKFLFLILVLFGFVFLFYLGMQIIGFFTSMGSSVYVISGMIPDMKAYNVVIGTDYTQPKSLTNIPIMRSNNQQTGLEFTWCCWLNLKPVMPTTGSDLFQTVFVKGSGFNSDASGNIGVNGVSTTNCPGVYVYNNNKTTATAGYNNVDLSNVTTNLIAIMIDTVTTPVSGNPDSNLNAVPQIIDISNIPINKWFHLVVRCQNKNIDIYVNGTIYQRKVLAQPPRQNSDSIHVCDNKPTGGSISDLRYFSYALSVVDINGIVNAGPNTNLYTGYANSSANGGGKFTSASYLSNGWYNKY
jgi:hypothetical protein